MKKLFGLDRPKGHASSPSQHQHIQPVLAPTASPQHHLRSGSPQRSHSHERWSLISNHDIPRSASQASIPLVSAPSPSLFPDQTGLSTPKPKKPPTAALGILSALDPHAQQGEGPEDSPPMQHVIPSAVEKKEKKGFWERAGVVNNAHTNHKQAKDKDARGRDKDKDKRGDEELTRMIGYLTATASEDWALVMEVCDRASASDAASKEAVRAIRREFRYGEPPAQLAAARLWAIMLRNSSETFVSQSTSRKFLDTVEDLLSSPRTSPVVRERLLDVLAAASYASSNRNEGVDAEGFRGLWKKVKPTNRPEAGAPLDTEDTMFVPVQVSSQPGTPVPTSNGDTLLPPDESRKKPRKRKSSTKNRIIPFDEDVRRLKQECIIGSGNASLLQEALKFAKPSDLKKKNVIQEFYAKCRSSHELIYGQIPWASSCAEQARNAKDKEQVSAIEAGVPVQEEVTKEEELLAALLEANEELQEALRMYEDLEQLSMEKKAKERSKKETRLERTETSESFESRDLSSRGPSSWNSHSRTPSPPSPPPPIPTHAVSSDNNHHHPPAPPILLAPTDSKRMSPDYLSSPAIIDDIPRSLRPRSFDSQASLHVLPTLPTAPQRQSFDSARPLPPPLQDIQEHSKPLPSGLTTSSTVSQIHDLPKILQPGIHGASAYPYGALDRRVSVTSTSSEYASEVAPSAKALGKRKVVDTTSIHESSYFPHVNGNGYANHQTPSNDGNDRFGDDDLDIDSSIQQLRHHSIHYIYDAAAERAKWLMENEGLESTVH